MAEFLLKNYPHYVLDHDVVEGVTRLVDTGKATIRGVKFDFAPKVHPPAQWLAHDFMFMCQTPPYLRFPWGSPASLPYDALLIQEGDTVAAVSYEQTGEGSTVWEEMDNLKRNVRLEVRRGRDRVSVPEPLVFSRRGSLVQRITFDDMVARCLATVGKVRSVKDLKQGRRFERFKGRFARLDRQRADERTKSDKISLAELAYCQGVGIDTLLESFQSDSPSFSDKDDAELFIKPFMNDLVAFGYFQAAAEFAPSRSKVAESLVTRSEASKTANEVNTARADVWKEFVRKNHKRFTSQWRSRAGVASRLSEEFNKEHERKISEASIYKYLAEIGWKRPKSKK